MTFQRAVKPESLVYSSFGRLNRFVGANSQEYQGAYAATTAYSHQFAFHGQELDQATGLQYHHARYYNPETQQFISQDPLGVAGGDTNLYRYAGGSPTNTVDVDGRAPVAVGAVVGGVIGVGAYLIGTPMDKWTFVGGASAGLGGALAGALAGATFGASLTALGGGATTFQFAAAAGISGAASGFGGAMLTSTINAYASGKSLGESLTAGAVDGAYGAVLGGATGFLGGYAARGLIVSAFGQAKCADWKSAVSNIVEDMVSGAIEGG